MSEVFPHTKPHTFQDEAVATADGSELDVKGFAAVAIQIAGTFVATVTFEGTIDDTNWIALQAANLNNGAIATTATIAGLFLLQATGLSQVRARVTWASGTNVTVTGRLVSMAYRAALGVPDAIQGAGSPSVDSFASAVVNLAASTADQELVATPGANKQIWVYGLFMMADTASGTVTLQDDDNTALSGTMAISDEGGWVLSPSGNFAMPWIKVATNKALEADTGACTVDGIILYAIVSV